MRFDSILGYEMEGRKQVNKYPSMESFSKKEKKLLQEQIAFDRITYVVNKQSSYLRILCISDIIP
ncbi:hypothetical protein A9C19_04870 [Bacillus weihaiensis]|uniref:Uncharacterized protein n=1 Tax=Bacillus weihaiensis TaxID=1547283 RepID=A0A1L3MP50_9BACI|nr:hypothetical protein A9C19_04870 [Bacillus weihaiensis]